MTDAQASLLYQQLVLLPLAASFVSGVILCVLHLMALHGRRLLPEPIQRTAGWFTVGLAVGLLTQWESQSAAAWAFVLGLVAWLAWWGWRAGRLRDVGVGLVGGAAPWAVSVGLFLVLLPPDPTIPVVDVRFLIVAGAVLVIGLGIVLIVGAPRGPAVRPLTPMERATLVTRAIDRAQAMGPLPAPLAVAFVVGVLASTAVLLVGRELEPIPRQVASGSAFVVVSLATWLVAMPRRVRDASAVLGWLIRTERAEWAARLGHRLPISAGGVTRLLKSLSDDASVRPLRIEILATLGRADEARAELALLPLETPEDRAVAAEHAEYTAWCDGRPDDGAIDRLAAEIPSISDPVERLRQRVVLAVARTRRAALADDPAAIDHLAAFRSEVGGPWSLLSYPGVVVTLAMILVVGVGGMIVLPAILLAQAS